MSNIQYVLWIRNISEMQEHSSFKNVVYSVLAKNRVEYQGYRRFFKHSKVPIVIYPYFDKGNKVFCEEELSYTIPELLSIPLKHNMVIANSILNTNTFGSLYILPNGSVYSDINCEKLAVLNDTITIKEILFIELTKKRNWYLTRNEVEPCNDCIFVNICPSITNIEHFMGKYDFCKIERGEA